MKLPDKEIGCHRTGFQKSCRECVVDHNCRLWQHIVGKDPQTDATIDNWGCADEFTNKLLIENSQMSRQTGASVDKVATEISRFHEGMVNMNLRGLPPGEDAILIGKD